MDMTPDRLYRNDDGEVFLKNPDGTYSMEKDMMHRPYKYSYEKLMETGAFSHYHPVNKCPLEDKCVKGEQYTVDDNLIKEIIEAIEIGAEYLSEDIVEHDFQIGRTIRKNKLWAENMERDLEKMRNLLEVLENLIKEENERPKCL